MLKNRNVINLLTSGSLIPGILFADIWFINIKFTDIWFTNIKFTDIWIYFQVVLPTFILERRSLLEMFADCMAHPDMFLK